MPGKTLRKTTTYKWATGARIAGLLIACVPAAAAFGWLTTEQASAITKMLIGLGVFLGGGTAIAIRKALL